MEGCLYKQYLTDSYYLVSGVASYFILVKDFVIFSERFIQKDEFHMHHSLIDYTPDNIKMLLDSYEKFENNVDYANLKDFYQIIYENRKYFIRTWNDVYEFVINNH